MDSVSVVASVIAIYLASTVSGLCFYYSQGVRGADQDADLLINEIDMFQRYLRSMKETLSNEIEAPDSTNRLRSLDEIISGESAALNCAGKTSKIYRLSLLRLNLEDVSRRQFIK